MSQNNFSAAFKNAAMPASLTLATTLITLGAANAPGSKVFACIPLAISAGSFLYATFHSFANGMNESTDSQPEDAEPAASKAQGETPKGP